MSQVTPPPSRLAIGRSSQRLGPVSIGLALLAVLFAVGLMGVDWNAGAAMALGELAGMFAPIALIGLLVWGVYAACKQSGRIRS
jgi:hypothetical protein